MKQYWLTLHQDAFLWVNSNKGCVYNTRNYKLFQFSCTNKQIQQFADELLQINNLYRTEINEDALASDEVRNWVDGLLKIEAAQLIENNGTNQRPVSLIPRLKIQESLSLYEYNREDSGRIMMHLHELIIHVNGSKYGNEQYYRQVTYPTNASTELKAEDIIRFLDKSGEVGASLNISLVGCIWEYTGREQLFEYLKSLGAHVSIYCTEKDYLEYGTHGTSPWESEQVSFHVLVSDYKQVNDDLFQSPVEGRDMHYGFIVTSEADYEGAASMIERNDVEKYRFYPVYTGDNLAFFEDTLYMTEEDMDTLRLSKRKIFAHQVLNTNYFGVLTITPDGLVYPGEIRKEIGTIEDTPFSLLYKEITQDKTWFYIREQGACKNCVYRQLCPSPSPYERVINKANLCHINNE